MLAPLIAVEGPEGSGKTTLIKRLSQEHGYARYRALSQGGERLTDIELTRYRQMGIPVGTFAEDLYPVDVLAQLRAGGMATRVILDRCMVSGLAYSDIDLSGRKARDLLEEWSQRFAAAGGRLLYVNCSIRSTQERLPEHDPRRHIDFQVHYRDRLLEVVRMLGREAWVDSSNQTAERTYADAMSELGA